MTPPDAKHKTMRKRPGNWIRESNLIEGVDDPKEDARSQRAWKWFLTQRLRLETILALHNKIMFKKLLSHERGHWRMENVTVGGRTPIDWSEVLGQMQAWEGNYHWADTEDQIKKAHIEFEIIHPFIDGNGRTGRMIMNWQRVKAGLEPLCIEAVKRWDYYKWFDV